jgi:hypothetical protein
VTTKANTIRQMISSVTHSKYYSPIEHSAVEEITILFKVIVILKQYILKKHKWFGIKIYKLCDYKGYTYNMRENIFRQRQKMCNWYSYSYLCTCDRSYYRDQKYRE